MVHQEPLDRLVQLETLGQLDQLVPPDKLERQDQAVYRDSQVHREQLERWVERDLVEPQGPLATVVHKARQVLLAQLDQLDR